MKRFIFLSNAIGGIASYQSNVINYLLQKNQSTLLIDKYLNETQKNINKKNKNHKLFVNDIFKNFFKVLKILENIRR